MALEEKSLIRKKLLGTWRFKYMWIIIKTGNNNLHYRARVQHVRPRDGKGISRTGGATVVAVSPEDPETALSDGPLFFVSKCNPKELFKKREGVIQALKKFLVHLKIDQFLEDMKFTSNQVEITIK